YRAGGRKLSAVPHPFRIVKASRSITLSPNRVDASGLRLQELSPRRATAARGATKTFTAKKIADSAPFRRHLANWTRRKSIGSSASAGAASFSRTSQEECFAHHAYSAS